MRADLAEVAWDEESAPHRVHGDGCLAAVTLRGVTKAFPGVFAVKGIDLDVLPGTVHGLVGENGAGKSTFIKMLAGAHAPDSGSIEVFGEPLAVGSPLAARKAGIAAIYQEPNIVPGLSPVANVFLGQERRTRGFLAGRAMNDRFTTWCDRLAVDLPLKGPTGALSIGAQQTIEIIRALEQGARIVIMDEPTAALAHAEIEALYRTIDVLRRDNAAVIFISHKLEEVLHLCDTVTVFRDGSKVESRASADLTVDTLLAAMLGDKLERTLEKGRRLHRRARGSPKTEIVRIEGLCVPNALEDISLTVNQGEIVGVAGLVGAGRTTMLRAIAGAEPLATGRMAIGGQAVAWPTTPCRALQYGIALAPEDRRTQGLILRASAAENIVMPSIGREARAGFLSARTIRRGAAETAPRVGFSPDRLAARARTLSGGNQQKIVLAKWLRMVPRVLLIDEPVRGIDVGAKAEIFDLIHALAGQGMSVVMVSEETEELMAVTDRIVVLCRGRLAGEFAGDAMRIDRVMKCMFPPDSMGDQR